MRRIVHGLARGVHLLLYLFLAYFAVAGGIEVLATLIPSLRRIEASPALALAHHNALAFWIAGAVVLALTIIWPLVARSSRRPQVDAPAIIAEWEQQKPVTVQKLVADLDERKEPFLAQVEASVREFISQSGAECLALVERDDDGVVTATYPLNVASTAYGQRLIHFMRHKPQDGRELDSALTDPIISLVRDQFGQLYQESTPILVGELIQASTMRRCLVDVFTQTKALRYAADKIKSQVMDLIFGQIEHAVARKVAVAITASAGVAIAAKIALMMVQHFGNILGPLIMKALAVPVVEKAILLLLKKFVAAALLATIAKAIALKLGIGIHLATTIVLLPVLAAFIAYDIHQFPAHLGKKVAQEVRNALDGSFAEINTTSMGELYDHVVRNIGDYGLDKVVDSFISTPGLDDEFAELASKVAQAI